ncbi:MAG: metallophosphoesterase [Verrucomicrobiota bacterium]|mgnify:CR=1 FL=1
MKFPAHGFQHPSSRSVSASQRRRTPVRRLIALLVTVLGVLRAAQAADRPDGTAGDSGRILVLSDFHLNPFLGLSQEQFAQLQSAPLEQWPDRLAIQPAAQTGSDSPWPLIRRSLEDARTQLPHPEFILLPGDFLTHRWNTNYDRVAPRSRTVDPAAFDAFTAHSLEFLAAQIRRAFPSTPILPVLGNEDSDCGDYKITPASPFLRRVAELWAPLIAPAFGDATNREAFFRTFPDAGYYSVPLPAPEPTRLIALNTILWTPQYTNACGTESQDPAGQQFRWLAETLDSLERSHEHAWLLMHVPPGIDDFETHKAGGVAQPLWRPDWAPRVMELLRRHRSSIRFSVAGHLHMDDFRILNAQSEIGGLVKVAPAISPVFGNNPAYQILLRDPISGTVTNYLTRRLPLRERGAQVPWETEYQFREGYPDARLTPEFLGTLASGIRSPGALQSTFLHRYCAGGVPSPVSPEILSCAIQHLFPDTFARCAPAPAGKP